MLIKIFGFRFGKDDDDDDEEEDTDVDPQEVEDIEGMALDDPEFDDYQDSEFIPNSKPDLLESDALDFTSSGGPDTEETPAVWWNPFSWGKK